MEQKKNQYPVFEAFQGNPDKLTMQETKREFGMISASLVKAVVGHKTEVCVHICICIFVYDLFKKYVENINVHVFIISRIKRIYRVIAIGRRLLST